MLVSTRYGARTNRYLSWTRRYALLGYIAIVTIKLLLSVRDVSLLWGDDEDDDICGSHREVSGSLLTIS